MLLSYLEVLTMMTWLTAWLSLVRKKCRIVSVLPVAASPSTTQGRLERSISDVKWWTRTDSDVAMNSSLMATSRDNEVVTSLH